MPEITHGLRNTYIVKHCRCDLCREAATTYVRKHRKDNIEGYLARERERRRRMKPTRRERILDAIRAGAHTRDAIKTKTRLDWDGLMQALTDMWDQGELVIEHSEYFEPRKAA